MLMLSPALRQRFQFNAARPRTLFALLALAVLVIAPATMHGQAQNTGTIAGSVFDSTHSVVPKAKVTLTSEDRGNIYTAVSNDQGAYTFNDVPVGSYSLQVEASGFSTSLSRHILLDSDTRLRVDATLQPGAVNAQVEVDANAVAVDTQSATETMSLRSLRFCPA
jgi:hypothetical protein